MLQLYLEGLSLTFVEIQHKLRGYQKKQGQPL